MRALSIFIFLTGGADELYEQTKIHWLDWPTRGNRETPSRSVPENHVARSVLIMIDPQVAGDHLQVLNPPIARIPTHFGEKFRRV